MLVTTDGREVKPLSTRREKFRSLVKRIAIRAYTFGRAILRQNVGAFRYV